MPQLKTPRKVRPIFQRVLDQFEGPAELARQVGATKQIVNHWLSLGWIPPDWAIAVSAGTGGKVTVLEILNESTREKIKQKLERDRKKEAKKFAQAVEEGLSDTGVPDGR